MFKDRPTQIKKCLRQPDIALWKGRVNNPQMLANQDCGGYREQSFLRVKWRNLNNLEGDRKGAEHKEPKKGKEEEREGGLNRRECGSEKTKRSISTGAETPERNINRG